MSHLVPPGPWGVEQTPYANWIGPVEADGKVRQPVCVINRDGLSGEALAQRDAIAQFLSAAPDLYKACRDYTEWWERVPDRECVAAVIENMRAALAKAEAR